MFMEDVLAIARHGKRFPKRVVELLTGESSSGLRGTHSTGTIQRPEGTVATHNGLYESQATILSERSDCKWLYVVCDSIVCCSQ